MAAVVKEAKNLGVPQFLKGVTPSLDDEVSGFYSDGRLPHREDGRPSKSDFLPRRMITPQTVKEETIMATTPSTKTPGANLGTPPNSKKGLKKNLDPANQTGSTGPKPGNDLK